MSGVTGAMCIRPRIEHRCRFEPEAAARPRSDRAPASDEEQASADRGRVPRPRHTPSYVAGFRALLDLNRCLRKGEKAIKILAPVAVKQRDDDGEQAGEKRIFFRTVPVFDVSQTDPLPGTEPVPLSPPAQPIEGDSQTDLIAPLKDLGRELGIAELGIASRSTTSPSTARAAGATTSTS